MGTRRIAAVRGGGGTAVSRMYLSPSAAHPLTIVAAVGLVLGEPARPVGRLPKAVTLAKRGKGHVPQALWDSIRSPSVRILLFGSGER